MMLLMSQQEAVLLIPRLLFLSKKQGKLVFHFISFMLFLHAVLLGSKTVSGSERQFRFWRVLYGHNRVTVYDRLWAEFVVLTLARVLVVSNVSSSILTVFTALFGFWEKASCVYAIKSYVLAIIIPLQLILQVVITGGPMCSKVMKRVKSRYPRGHFLCQFRRSWKWFRYS